MGDEQNMNELFPQPHQEVPTTGLQQTPDEVTPPIQPTPGEPALPVEESLEGERVLAERSLDRRREEAEAKLDAIFKRKRPTLGNAAPPEPGRAEGEPEPRKGGMASRFMLDLARGYGEVPRAFRAGARDAVQETSDLLDEGLQWMTKKFPGGQELVEKMGPEGIIPDLPEVDDPKSVSAGILKSATQFLVGFYGASKVVKGAGWLAAGAKGMLADFTVFDGHEDRLSNFIENTSLKNPVTEFLAAKKEDSELVGRLKNAIEGAGLGVMTDGLITALRAMKSIRVGRAMQAAAAKGEGAALPPRSARTDQLESFGDPYSDKLFIKRARAKLADTAADMKDAKSSDVRGKMKDVEDEFYINLLAIDTPEKIKTTIRKMVEYGREGVEKARRGKMSWEATKLKAEEVNAWELLFSRRQGQAFNAEETLAARQLWHTSATKVRELADLIAKDGVTEEKAFLFRKAVAIHNAIQKEVLGARTETARALNMWKMPTGGKLEMAQQMDMMLNQNGGIEVVAEMAQRMKKLSDAGMVTEMEHFVQGSSFARSRKAVQQLWINSLLSNPQTHLVNMMSNFAVIAQTIAERQGAEIVSRLSGGPNGVAPGEAFAMMHGAAMGAREGFILLSKRIRKGLGADIPGKELKGVTEGIKPEIDTGDLIKQETPIGALSSEAWGVAKDSVHGRALDLADAVTQVPGRLLSESDHVFKTIGYRMELYSQATRKATQESVTKKYTREELKNRIQELISSPTEQMRMDSLDAALYQTFQNKPAEWAQKLGSFADSIPVPGLGRLALPFRNTPSNILNYTLERTPFAPLVKRWRQDIAAGGARKDIALARTSMGIVTSMVFMDLAFSGAVTGAGPAPGPERENWLRMGNQPYSIRIGDKWFSYNRLDPIGFQFGMAADLAEVISTAEDDVSESDFQQVLVFMSLSSANSALSKTYLQGAEDMIAAVHNPKMLGNATLNRIVGSAVPAGVANLTRLNDPYMRVADDAIQSLRRRTPGLSEGLPLYRDLWGRERSTRSPLGLVYDALSPLYIRQDSKEPIDEELKRLEYFPSMPQRKMNFQVRGTVGATVKLSHEQYSRYMELRGKEVKDVTVYGGAFYGQSLLEALNGLVTGKNPFHAFYATEGDGPDGGKAQMIEKIIGAYGDRAKEVLYRENKQLQADWDYARLRGSTKKDPEVTGFDFRKIGDPLR